MRRPTIKRVVGFFLFGVVAITAAGMVTMSLWNWLTPPLFGLPAINFGQALGLLVLTRVLFGRFPAGGRHRAHWRERMSDRWQSMTPEQREALRAGLRTDMCGPKPAPAAQL